MCDQQLDSPETFLSQEELRALHGAWPAVPFSDQEVERFTTPPTSSAHDSVHAACLAPRHVATEDLTEDFIARAVLDAKARKANPHPVCDSFPAERVLPVLPSPEHDEHMSTASTDSSFGCPSELGFSEDEGIIPKCRDLFNHNLEPHYLASNFYTDPVLLFNHHLQDPEQAKIRLRALLERDVAQFVYLDRTFDILENSQSGWSMHEGVRRYYADWLATVKYNLPSLDSFTPLPLEILHEARWLAIRIFTLASQSTSMNLPEWTPVEVSRRAFKLAITSLSLALKVSIDVHYPLCVIEPWSLVPLFNQHERGCHLFSTRDLRKLERQILFLPLINHRLLCPTPHALIEELQFASPILRELRNHSSGMHEYMPSELDIVLQKMTRDGRFTRFSAAELAGVAIYEAVDSTFRNTYTHDCQNPSAIGCNFLELCDMCEKEREEQDLVNMFALWSELKHLLQLDEDSFEVCLQWLRDIPDFISSPSPSQ